MCVNGTPLLKYVTFIDRRHNKRIYQLTAPSTFHVVYLPMLLTLIKSSKILQIHQSHTLGLEVWSPTSKQLGNLKRPTSRRWVTSNAGSLIGKSYRKNGLKSFRLRIYNQLPKKPEKHLGETNGS